VDFEDFRGQKNKPNFVSPRFYLGLTVTATVSAKLVRLQWISEVLLADKHYILNVRICNKIT
jgi:hypothetical protein